MSNYPGYFITFEGGEGAGKSTILHVVAPKLVEMGLPVITLREPGGTLIGDQLRDVVHSLNNHMMMDETETLIYQASRAQNVGENIRPNLLEGKIIIQDRYIDSTLAYQGYARGIKRHQIEQLNYFSTGGILPDLTLFFDVKPEEGLRRKKSTSIFGAEWNRMDDLELRFHNKVHEAYRVFHAYDETGRWVRIDANKTREEVMDQVLGIITERLEKDWSPEGQHSSPERLG